MEKNKNKSFIGIDVSKNKLDIFALKTGEFKTIPNTKPAIKKYIKSLEISDNLYVVIDLTGGYEALCVDLFYEAGFQVIRAEGRKVKSFSKAMGEHAKTDKIDARILARYGEKCFDFLRIYRPYNNKIKKLVMRLSDIKQLLQEEKNRLKAPDNLAIVSRSIKQVIGVFEGEITKLEDEIEKIIAQNENLKKKYDLLVAQKGVGKKIALVMLGLLPELGEINRRQIAALAGVAPYAKDSGSLSGHRFTRCGRPEVKKALFTAALVAVRYDDKYCCIYNELLSRAKPKMAAMVAVMRRLLITLNAKMKGVCG